jgi:hypothetical protein
MGNAELCKQVFFLQPKPNQVKYAEKHCIVQDDILKLQEFFEGHHNTRELTKTKRRPRKMQRQTRVPIATIETIALGNLTVKTTMIISLMINDVQMIVKRMIVIPVL